MQGNAHRVTRLVVDEPPKVGYTGGVVRRSLFFLAAAVIALGTLGPRPGDLAQRLRPLQSQRTQRVFVYEAGPCGAWRSRSLLTTG